MSSNILQGLQSCLESQIVDASESKNSTNGDEMGSWNFIKALTKTPQTPQKLQENNSGNEKVYVHPLAKHTASMLSEKSLEMCTESLGSETGSDISGSIDDSYCYLSDNAEFSPKSYSKNVGTSWEATKKTCQRSACTTFPPPLTSLNSSGGCFRVKSHREDGRLVIETITVSSKENIFHAERGNGRLRLHLLKVDAEDYDIKSSAEEDEDVDSLEGKMGIEKFRKSNKCTEDNELGKNNGLWNLEAYWVGAAT